MSFKKNYEWVEYKIENRKLECVPKSCYLGDTLGAEGGVEEAARASVRYAWAKFKELSSILTAGVHHTE